MKHCNGDHPIPGELFVRSWVKSQELSFKKRWTVLVLTILRITMNFVFADKVRKLDACLVTLTGSVMKCICIKNVSGPLCLCWGLLHGRMLYSNLHHPICLHGLFSRVVLLLHRALFQLFGLMFLALHWNICTVVWKEEGWAILLVVEICLGTQSYSWVEGALWLPFSCHIDLTPQGLV